MKRRVVIGMAVAVLLGASASAQTTNFLEVVEAGTPQEVEAAIRNGADVNARDMEGNTALMYACYYQRYEVVGMLLRAGADVNVRGRDRGFTALMWAVMYYERPDEILKLLDAGADAKVKDPTGKTALDRALENWRFEGTEALRRLQEASK